MSGFKKALPKTSGELRTYLRKIHDNRSHVKRIEVKNGRIEITLDGAAHFTGNPDVYLPVKSGSADEADDLVAKIWKASGLGAAPTDADADALFGLLDPMGN